MGPEGVSFPRAPETYADVAGLWPTLSHRVSEEPFNLVATLIFVVNLVGWPLTPSAGLHLLGVWLVLGLSTVNFVGLVLQRVLGDSPGRTASEDDAHER